MTKCYQRSKVVDSTVATSLPMVACCYCGMVNGFEFDCAAVGYQNVKTWRLERQIVIPADALLAVFMFPCTAGVLTHLYRAPVIAFGPAHTSSSSV